jgi:hypothetical protein
LLGQLLDKSLVVVEDQSLKQVRFRLLETIRQYAWERLDEAGEIAPTRARHLSWCLQLANDVQPPGMHHPWHAEDLIQEQDNLRAALLWVIQEGNAEAGLGVAGAGAHLVHARPLGEGAASPSCGTPHVAQRRRCASGRPDFRWPPCPRRRPEGGADLLEESPGSGVRSTTTSAGPSVCRR